MTDVAAWLGQFSAGDDLSPLERASALTAMRDRKDQLEAERDQADKAAAAAERREALEFHNAQAGDPLGHLSLARARFTEHDDRCRDLRDQLRKAEAKRDRSRGEIEWWARQLEPVEQAAQRSRVPSDPVEAAVYRAHEAFRDTTRAMRTGTRPRPFGRGVIARSEVTCEHCKAMGLDVTPEESFLIHHMDADGNPLSAQPDRPVPVPDDAERAREVGRLMGLGYSRGVAETAMEIAR
jgi:hypothetical protein